MKYIVILLAIIFFKNSYAQTLTAKVVDEDGEPVIGANVYFDNTTLGVITDLEGKFSINKPQKYGNLTLVISYLGYQTLIEKDLDSLKSVYTLKSKTDNLETVQLYTQHFSRKRMEKAFKAHFLGLGREARKSKILNIDDIILYYNKADNTFHAEIYEPIIVKNDYLGYKISFDLEDFTVKFRRFTLNYSDFEESYYFGYSYYEDMNPNKIDSRIKTFLGSKEHFFKMLINDQMHRSEFKVLYIHNFKEANEIFDVDKISSNAYEICVKDEIVKHLEEYGIVLQVTIIHKNENSTIRFLEPCFIVDNLGNEMQLKTLYLFGDFANYKVAKSLPQDFIVDYKEHLHYTIYTKKSTAVNRYK